MSRYFSFSPPVTKRANFKPLWRKRLAQLPIVGAIALCSMGSVLPSTALAATIQGTAFTDWNDNQVLDPWEPVLANQYVSIWSSASGLNGATTDANGKYSLISLAAGSYVLRCDDLLYDGLELTTPVRGDFPPVEYDITVTASQTATVNFGFLDRAEAGKNVVPVINIDNTNVTVDAGDSVTLTGNFTDTDANDQHLLKWDFGNGETASTKVVTKTVTVIGTHTFTYTVTDSRGAVVSTNVTVTVQNKLPTITVNVNSTSVSIGNGISFTGTVNDTAGETHTIRWDFGDGNSSSRINSNHTYAMPGTYVAKLTVTDNNGGASTAQKTVIVTNTPPTVTANANPITIRVGDSVSFSGRVVDPNLGNTPTYAWNFGDGNTANSLTKSHTFKAKGTFTTTLSVTDSYGASSSDTVTIVVKGALPVISINGNNVVAVDSGDTVDFSGSFTDADGGTHTYVWKFGDGDTAVGAAVAGTNVTASHIFRATSPTEGFPAILEITDNEGNKSSAQMVVHVRGLNTDPCIASVPTIRSVKNRSAWINPRTWNTGKVPTTKDWVSVSHNVLMLDNPRTSANEGKVRIKGLCVEQNGVLEGNGGRNGLPTPWIEITAGIVNNKGTIKAGLGVNGNGPYANRTAYSNATEGGSIKIATGNFTNDTTAKIIGGRGGDDLIYIYFPNQWGTYTSRSRGLSVNAISGDGGQITSEAYTIFNYGLVQAGHGGFASTNNRTSPPWGQWWYSNRSRYKINFSNANAGDGGSINASARNITRGMTDSINRGQFISGNGGDAIFFTKFGGHGNDHAGKGGSARVDVSKQFGLVRVGNRGRWSRWEPILLEASNTTRFEGGENLVIFAGENAEMNLRELVPGAISAEKTITIAVGAGGTIDLTGVSGEVFKAAEKVEIFADNLLLEEGASLESLTNAPNVEIGPSKIIYDVTLSNRDFIVGQPDETIPVSIEIKNGSPANDTYTINVTDTAGWQLDNLPASIEVNGLRSSTLMLNVTLPNGVNEENVITVTATSQGDPDVQAIAEIRMEAVSRTAPPPPPRGTETADVVLAIDNSATMGSEILDVSNAVEMLINQFGEPDPAAAELEEFMNQFGEDGPPEAELDTFLTQLNEKHPPKADPLEGFPMIELLTFKDEVISQIVSKDTGAIITQLRNIDVSGGDDCPNASVAALEQALANVNDNGTIILATASNPHKDAAAMIEQAKQRGVKVSVLLAGSCGDEAADKALYQNIADNTGGTFKWLPDATDDEDGIVGVISNVVTDGLEKFISTDDTNNTDDSNSIVIRDNENTLVVVPDDTDEPKTEWLESSTTPDLPEGGIRVTTGENLAEDGDGNAVVDVKAEEDGSFTLSDPNDAANTITAHEDGTIVVTDPESPDVQATFDNEDNMQVIDKTEPDIVITSDSEGEVKVTDSTEPDLVATLEDAGITGVDEDSGVTVTQDQEGKEVVTHPEFPGMQATINADDTMNVTDTEVPEIVNVFNPQDGSYQITNAADGTCYTDTNTRRFWRGMSRRISRCVSRSAQFVNRVSHRVHRVRSFVKRAAVVVRRVSSFVTIRAPRVLRWSTRAVSCGRCYSAITHVSSRFISVSTHSSRSLIFARRVSSWSSRVVSVSTRISRVSSRFSRWSGRITSCCVRRSIRSVRDGQTRQGIASACATWDDVVDIDTSVGDYTASGTVKDNTGKSITNVTIQIGNRTVVTVDGNWEILDLANGNYTITATKEGVKFEPQNLVVDGENVTLNLEGEVLGDYTIYGTIRDELGNKLDGVEVQAAGQTVTTDAAANWEIPNLQEGEYTLTASKEGYIFANEDVALGNDEFRTEVVIVALSKLKVKVVADPRIAKQGDNVTYIVTVISGGEATATGITLTDVLPANAGGLISIEALDGGECDAATVTCTLPDLTTGNSARVKLVVSNTQASSLLNTATVTANEYPADVQKTRTRVIPHLAASITDTPDPLQLPLPGEQRTLHYNVAATLSANAPSAATGVNLVMMLPKSVELQAVNSDAAMCDTRELPVLTCQLIDLSVDNADSISHVTVGIDVVLKDAGLLTLTLEAKVSANEYPVHTDKERTKIFIDPQYKVDIAFVIDDSGSMQGEINQVKAAINKVIDEIGSNQAPLSVLLTFGDEVKYRAVTQDMTVLRDTVAKLKASGGGTCPEASYEAISFAIPHVKEGGTILFATDASPYEGSDVDDMIARLNSNGIRFNAMVFGDCTNPESWNQLP
ncbi:PKD domain-containing protein [Candidatus Parabeggiatoa sp. HSG14]|uniref:PKD domain-containing protein n=1 Tax=Candidatus Parabeggiatoa sp. HSG14 TaxID=3055593 RepID=UPI0025A84799|nr:PKD domain-containing protein [Thiotrichales bacterium HSG14]